MAGGPGGAGQSRSLVTGCPARPGLSCLRSPSTGLRQHPTRPAARPTCPAPRRPRERGSPPPSAPSWVAASGLLLPRLPPSPADHFLPRGTPPCFLPPHGSAGTGAGARTHHLAAELEGRPRLSRVRGHWDLHPASLPQPHGCSHQEGSSASTGPPSSGTPRPHRPPPSSGTCPRPQGCPLLPLLTHPQAPNSLSLICV